MEKYLPGLSSLRIIEKSAEVGSDRAHGEK
jgi:hypothetical protein